VCVLTPIAAVNPAAISSSSCSLNPFHERPGFVRVVPRASDLRVFCGDAKYLLAMKCLAMRMGECYRDEDDIRYPLKHLGIEGGQAALAVVGKSYDLDAIPSTALAAPRELNRE